MEDQLFEDITFERCFYIYGGPEQLEELEALSNHYVLIYNRRKAKLPSEQKSIYDGKLKEVQDIFDLGADLEGSGTESEKGKKVEAGTDYSNDEMKNLHDSSIRKAADLAAGFTNALAGLAPDDIIQKLLGDSISFDQRRISEICCFALTQLLALGKSMIANANKIQDEEIDEETLKIDWPEDFIEKAKIIRTKVQSMTVNVEAVSKRFITGQSSAVKQIQDGLRYLSCVVLSTSMPAA
ncbi:Putative pectate lyase 2 [Olea europaea subsp. europaea]|uniref:Pectate lyase 2 n=1 Tax=Olea europaea subsp. europaea TaxID=158383 RepID=A0A8S0UHH8_OLEEU|nr:Putative pectate lyase 2 [Olea europaea subsp. europaea]